MCYGTGEVHGGCREHREQLAQAGGSQGDLSKMCYGM